MIIKDGRGNAFLAGVNRRHQLETDAVTRAEMAYVSDIEEQAYVLTTGNMAIVASEYAIIRAVLPIGTAHIHVDRVWLNWNGGNTSHNRVMFARFYGGMPEPSANNEAVAPGNMHVGSSNATDLAVEKWDGVGSGMTVASNGLLIGTTHCRQGLTEISAAGTIVLEKDGVLAMTLEGEEAGVAAVGLTFWVAESGD